MQFQEGFFLKYSVVDLSSDDGKTIDPNGRFFVYNPQGLLEQDPQVYSPDAEMVSDMFTELILVGSSLSYFIKWICVYLLSTKRSNG